MEPVVFTLPSTLRTDSYKSGHAPQYPPNTEVVYSYFESRGGRFPEVVFFGLQYYLLSSLVGAQVTEKAIEQTARRVALTHGGDERIFNRHGFEHILHEHGGRWPIEIKAVPEGTPVTVRNVMMTMQNTCYECFWVTNYLETLLSQVWDPCTVATQSREMKKIIKTYAGLTGGDPFVDFKLHDFGVRGSSTMEEAAIAGAGHLVNFQGTDNYPALELVDQFYGEPAAGFSIPAAEHSTITMWGRNGEKDAYANMLYQFPDGLVAVVSDSYDIFNAVSNIWGDELYDQVVSRGERGGTLVIRPDSGPPAQTVVEVLRRATEKFGAIINEHGYKALPQYVRVIQGDGIDFDSLSAILEAMRSAGFSTDNIAFGSGGGLLRKVDRDTCKFAIKCSFGQVAGEERRVQKNPVTDPGKRSKGGRLALVSGGGDWQTVAAEDDVDDKLETVFRDGELVRRHSFAEIRERAAI